MRHPVNLLPAIAGVLTLACTAITLATLEDQPQRLPEGHMWWAGFAAEYRRRPRLRGIQLACLAIALGLYVSYVIVVFS